MKKSGSFILKLSVVLLYLMTVSQSAIFAEVKNNFSDKNYQSIFYVNDLHGQIPTMIRINNAATQFEASVTDKKNVDAFMFSAGDICIGSDNGVNRSSIAFMNISDITDTAIGNHEFDMGATSLSKVYTAFRGDKIASNAYIPDKNPLKKQVVTSKIVTAPSGQKYGIVGAQSPTLIERMKDKSLFEGIEISGGKVAYAQIQKEVDKLQNQGINRIIMLSHSGYEEEKEYAKNISGVDVIIGGHSHDLIFDIKEGANLQYSPKGEPVVITQAGRDGKNFGILNVQYDENGIIVKAQNNVFDTRSFGKGTLMTTATNVIMGQSPVVAKIQSVEPLTAKMNIEENPYADVFSDIVKKETGADIVLINSANFRGTLDVGDVTARDIGGIFPFKNLMCVVELSEKNLVEALNRGGSSLLAPDLKPSILQVSGMTYTLSKEGKVTRAAIIKDDGTLDELNVKNPSSTKMIKAAYDDYLLNGGDAFVSLKNGVKLLKKYPYDKDRIVIEYLQKNKQVKPLVIKKDGRIKFE